eukprot:15339393-Ditylum_brightwellii.AAC.1
MTDISAFRYSFCQEIKYFEPTTEYPDHQWRIDHFVGTAWDSGDDFTFKVWTEPDGKWKKGSELMQNVIQPHHSKLLTVNKEELDNMSPFKFQKKTPTKKRHGWDQHTVYELVDVRDLDEEIEEKQMNQELEEPVDSCTESALDCNPRTDLETDLYQDAGENEQIKEQNDSTSSTTTTTQNKNNFQVAPLAQAMPDDGVDLEPIKMVSEVNDQLSRPDESVDMGGSGATESVGHQWKNRQVSFKVQWSDSDTTWDNLKDRCQDHPRMTTHYV